MKDRNANGHIGTRQSGTFSSDIERIIKSRALPWSTFDEQELRALNRRRQLQAARTRSPWWY